MEWQAQQVRRRDRQVARTDLRGGLVEDEEGLQGGRGDQGGKVHSGEGRARSGAAEGGNLKTVTLFVSFLSITFFREKKKKKKKGQQ